MSAIFALEKSLTSLTNGNVLFAMRIGMSLVIPPPVLAVSMLMALALARDFDASAQQVDPNFSPPLFWERCTDYTFAQGPYRSFVDGRGGVYVVGNGRVDVVGGGWFQEPIRLLETNAAVDSTFRSEVAGGFATAIQPDTKLLISSSSDGADVVLRLTASGALDPSFTPVGFSQSIRHLAVLPGGKILAVVWGNIYQNPSLWAIPTPNPTVFRLHANGRVDQSFRRPEFTGGILSLYAPPVVDGAGRIYLGGQFTTVNGVSRTNLVRFLADGNVDESFAGSTSVPGGLGGRVRHIAIQSDGRVVVVGDLRIPSTAPSADRIAAIRFDSNGQFDPTFTTNKVSQLGPWDYPRAMVLRPDDKFVTVSSGLRQFNANGTIDPLFNASDFTGYAYWISRLSDGRLMVPGGNPAEGLNVFAPNGTPDLTFTTGGFGYTTPPGSHVFLGDGRIAVCGQFSRVGSQPQLGLAILSPETGQALSPQPDLTPLAPGGVMFLNATVTKAVAGPSNTFWFLAGVMDTNYANRLLFGKVLGTGAFDPAAPVQEWGGSTNSGDDLYPLADGRLLVADNSAQGAVNGATLRRLFPSGTVDPAFAGLDPGLRGQLAQVTWLPDNSIQRIEVGQLRILISSGPTNLLASVNTIYGEARLVRLNPDGNLDTSFSPSVIDGLNYSQNFPEVYNPRTQTFEQTEVLVYGHQVFSDAAELQDGRLLVCGQFYELGAVSVPYLARLNANGSVDTNFPGLRLEYSKSPFWEPRLTSIEADAQGRIYVAGLFDRINTIPAPGLARLLPDGTVDETFLSPITISPYPYLAVHLKLVEKSLYVFGNCAQGNTRRMGWRLRVEEELTLAWHTGAGGQLELTVPSSPTKATMVQASDDLASWVEVFTNAVGAAATKFTDPEAAGKARRYYRLRQ